MSKILDNCVPVQCRKCSQYLATIIPKAEALCWRCSSTLRLVWSVAKKPPSQRREAVRKRAYRKRVAAHGKTSVPNRRKLVSQSRRLRVPSVE